MTCKTSGGYGKPSTFMLMLDCGNASARFDFGNRATALPELSLRHNTGTNFLFVDGHVEHVKPLAMPDAFFMGSW